MSQTTGSFWKTVLLEGALSADTEFSFLGKGVTCALKNRWQLWQWEIVLPQTTAAHCIVVLGVLSHQWIFYKGLIHFHKAVLRRTLCAGSWMCLRKRHQYKDLWVKMQRWAKWKWGAVIVHLTGANGSGGEQLLWPNCPRESGEWRSDLWIPFQYLSVPLLRNVGLTCTCVMSHVFCIH